MTVYYAGASYADISVSLNNALGVARGNYPSWGAAFPGTRFNSNLFRGYTSLENDDYEIILDLGTDVDEVWLHFDQHGDSNTTTTGLGYIWFYGSSLNLLHAVVSSVTSSTGQMNLRPSTDGVNFGTAYSGTTFTIALGSTLTQVDVHLKIDASTGVFSVYQAGVLAATFTGDTTANGSNLIRYIRIASGTSVASRRPSGIIAASESTIGWKCQELYPVTGTQSFSDWTGDYSVLDDYAWTVTKTDSAYANGNNDTSSYAANNTHSSMSTLVPVCLAVSARAFNTEDSAVSGLELGVAIGGTYYGSGVTETLAAEDGEVPVQQIFHTNPSNSSAWSISDLDAVQMAIRAKT